MEKIADEKQSVFHSFKIRLHKKTYHVLMPRQDLQLWVRQCLNPGNFFGIVNIDGNRTAIETLRDACIILAKESHTIVYFPCKRTKILDFEKNKISRWSYSSIKMPVDMVLMTPNALKLSEWKTIRNKLKKANKCIYAYQHNTDILSIYNTGVHKKFQYKKPKGKQVIRYETVFFNTLYYEYWEIAKKLGYFLNRNLEENLLRTKPDIMDWIYFYYIGSYISGLGLEIELGFYDEIIAGKYRW